MFSRTSVLYAISSLAVLAAATNHPVTTTVTAPGHTSTPIPASQCNTAGLQCCNSVQPASSSAVAGILGLLGVVIQDLTVAVGLTCSPINVLGIGSGGACTAQPVCCDNNDFASHGVIAIGCTPINIGL